MPINLFQNIQAKTALLLVTVFSVSSLKTWNVHCSREVEVSCLALKVT